MPVREWFLEDLEKFRERMSTITAKQAHAETAQLAERVGLDLDDLRRVVPGKALDEKQRLSYLQALEPQVEQLTLPDPP
jgi:3-hydroxyisobutyrate dehydrogenase-like beta-hydroxyacid dehydrogenase